MVWLLEAARKMNKGLEQAGLMDSDWQIFPGPSMRGSCLWWSGFVFSHQMYSLFLQLAAQFLCIRLWTRARSRLRRCIRPIWKSWGNYLRHTKGSTVFPSTRLSFLNDYTLRRQTRGWENIPLGGYIIFFFDSGIRIATGKYYLWWQMLMCIRGKYKYSGWLSENVGHDYTPCDNSPHLGRCNHFTG